MAATVKALDYEWELDVGFLGRLRHGHFDADGAERLIALLQSIQIADTATALDREIVRLTWQIPLFMQWQIDRVKERGGDWLQLNHTQARIEAVLEQILGIP